MSTSDPDQDHKAVSGPGGLEVNPGSHQESNTEADPLTEPFVIVYGPELASYDFGESHPLQPRRYQLTMLLLSTLGWLDSPEVKIHKPRPATITELLAVHSYTYIRAVQIAQSIARGQHEAVNLETYGLGTSDNPLFPDMHEAAALYTGASIQAMQTVLDGRALHAYSPAGGQHHAHRSRASGFCIYNDCAAAIATAVAAGLRVAYIDLDAHHGDGVQAAFYDSPAVLTISIHEAGEFLFPGTGDIGEIGRDEGRGYSLNVPLPPFVGNEAYLQAFERVIAPALRCYAPDIVVTQIGADSHHTDPLTHLTSTLALFPELAQRLHRLVHECARGRWLILGGGGYDSADVTPRAWTAFVGTVLGHNALEVSLPAEWLRASRQAGGDPPAWLLEDPGPGLVPRAPYDVETILTDIERRSLAELRARMKK